MGLIAKKQKKLPFLGIIMNRNEFFNKLKMGDIFTYSGAYKVDNIKEIATLNGLTVEYCKPRSPEYTRYGCFTMKVVAEVKKVEPQTIFYFDPELLDINIPVW